MIKTAKKEILVTKKVITLSILILLSTFFHISANAENQTIEMLNKLGKETMVFSKKL